MIKKSPPPKQVNKINEINSILLLHSQLYYSGRSEDGKANSRLKGILQVRIGLLSFPCVDDSSIVDLERGFPSCVLG